MGDIIHFKSKEQVKDEILDMLDIFIKDLDLKIGKNHKDIVSGNLTLVWSNKTVTSHCFSYIDSDPLKKKDLIPDLMDALKIAIQGFETQIKDMK